MAIEAQLDRLAGALPWRMVGWGTAVALLLVPLALDFPWTVGDFIFAAVIFAIVGGIFELAVWRSPHWSYRIAVGLAVACAVLHVWITGAVGIIGSEDNPGNLVYLGVVAVAIFGSIVALGRPAGMALAMGIAAAAEVTAPLLAYWLVADPASDVLLPVVFGSAVVFTGMWLTSALLFRAAARK